MRRILFAGTLLLLMYLAFAPAAQIGRLLSHVSGAADLPQGAALREALRSCRTVRDGEREVALCPQRLPLRAFPRHLVDALIVSEDRGFFAHEGIDKVAVLSAAFGNVARSLREQRLTLRRGGSTITQQFARTLFLDGQDGLMRKLQEFVLAPRIEALLSKQEILAGYMNIVPHARGLHGFDAAARQLFGVAVGDVDLAEAALLVGMLPAPNLRDPARHPQAALAAVLRVLERMADERMIGAADLRAAEKALTQRILSRRLRRGREALQGERIVPPEPA